MRLSNNTSTHRRCGCESTVEALFQRDGTAANVWKVSVGVDGQRQRLSSFLASAMLMLAVSVASVASVLFTDNLKFTFSAETSGGRFPGSAFSELI